MVRSAQSVIALLLFALAAAAPAQDNPSAGCQNCLGTGSLPCRQHGKLLDKEKGVQFCSVASECKACSGALQVDCKQCRNPKVEDELAARIKLVQDWRQDRKTKVDDVAKGQPLLHLVTAHFDLSYGLRPLTIGKDKLDPHTCMHIYAERLEALRAQFVELLGVGDKEQVGRLQVFMQRDLQGHQNLAPVVTDGLGGGVAVGVKVMGLLSVYCMWQEPRSLPDDEAVHRNIVHNVSHLLLCNLKPEGVLYDKHAGWIDEGFAHWWEDKITGKCSNFCYEEVLMQPGASFKGGHWRPAVRRMVDEGKLTSFATLAAKNTDQLDFPEHAESFALVDWLLTVHGGAKFKTFAVMLKSGKATRDALQAVYGLAPLAVDNEFTTWVKANYSPLDPPR
jgi:hypothetical protein